MTLWKSNKKPWPNCRNLWT